MPSYETCHRIAAYTESLDCLDKVTNQPAVTVHFYSFTFRFEISSVSFSLYSKCVKSIKKMPVATNVNEHINFAGLFFLSFFLVASKFSMPGLPTAESAVPRSRSVF